MAQNKWLRLWAIPGLELGCQTQFLLFYLPYYGVLLSVQHVSLECCDLYSPLDDDLVLSTSANDYILLVGPEEPGDVVQVTMENMAVS